MREGLIADAADRLRRGAGRRRHHLHVGAARRALQANIIRRTLNFQAPIGAGRPTRSRAAAQRWPGTDRRACSRASQQLRSVDQWQKVARRRSNDARRARRRAGGVRPRLRAARRRDRGHHIIGIEPDIVLRRHRAAREDRRGQSELGPIDIIIGTELAQGPRCQRRRQDALARPRTATAQTLTVAGIFDFGNKGVNERNVYVSLRTAQNLLDLVGGVSSIEVNVRDPFAAETMAQAIRGDGDLRGRQLDHDQRAVLHARWRRRSSPTR